MAGFNPKGWIFPQKLQFFLHHMCFLYVFLQIAFGQKIFPTKVPFFSTCVSRMWFFKLPSAWKIFPQKLQFFLCVFFGCDSSNCLRPEKFSHKNCTFFFLCTFYVFLQIAFGQKHFPQKLHSFLHVFLYVFLRIACGPKHFPTKIAIFFFFFM